MLERNITIREIEEKDKASYLNLFNSESFGCIGINSNQKPSIYAEEQVLDSVIRGENIATKILVIEDNNQFVGYALIEKKNDWLYHIGEFVICKPLRNQGYGSILIERVKSYADIDGCNIDLECLTRAESFFRNHQFTNKDIYFKYSSPYYQKPTRRSPIYMDYSIIREREKKEEERQIKSYKKFLESPLAKDIFSML